MYQLWGGEVDHVPHHVPASSYKTSAEESSKSSLLMKALKPEGNVKELL